VPQWYDGAKFGIMVHWSLACVPAYAPTGRGDIVEILRRYGAREMLANQPYAEWYLNSLRIEGSPVYEYHREKYGADFDYYRFSEEFNEHLGEWDPGSWAELFSQAGARYVVYVTKHHDGFLLWPSRHPNPVEPDLCTTRNTVEELSGAVRERGMRMGFYYSSLLDWSFTEKPIVDMASVLNNWPTGKGYADYSVSHWRELIDTWAPDVLWSDIGFPHDGDLYSLFAHYYNTVPEGVVNDRWATISRPMQWLAQTRPGNAVANRMGTWMFINGATTPVLGHCDYITPEYAVFSGIKKKKWECVRGIGTSFGFNQRERPENFISVRDLVRLLVDVVSKNGNLLLNVGPKVGGSIPEVQIDRLKGLGAWMDVNSEAIYDTRPWVRAEGSTEDGLEARFTHKGRDLYVLVFGVPGTGKLVIEDVPAAAVSEVSLLGRDGALDWRPRGSDMVISLEEKPTDQPVTVFRVSPFE